MTKSNIIVEIQKVGKSASGKTDLLKHLSGGKITRNQAIKGKCYDCTGYASDGRPGCSIESCALFPFSPYRNREKNNTGRPIEALAAIEQQQDGSSIKEVC